MAAFDTTQQVQLGATKLGLVAWALSAVSSIATWNASRVTRKQLAALTDRELDDIGLTRADVDAMGAN